LGADSCYAGCGCRRLALEITVQDLVGGHAEIRVRVEMVATASCLQGILDAPVLLSLGFGIRIIRGACPPGIERVAGIQLRGEPFRRLDVAGAEVGHDTAVE